ncbi:uncharacterized protein L969DRAFT_43182 [Mixia osmundae IAM 14324]|uniref:mitochondrial intermediate peptidase n=1 Tax=Mixia osmundae (strain CBS 9802 / IAM 14324 / JCM 22182 / KY 12970) TaxID=764103 RepID=G7DX85_MIXOS|nr:uncharacterized protein L969DRAFT_43182 [Mixia osmundae IAM 14324]KEI42642.1 hypothetical protein L969DRAFT_43182 [Mixia osmundae IAM 14324]GAA95195.1 hypothetical protein E5Q_01850 [Mixia osmundae IAM 14324]
MHQSARKTAAVSGFRPRDADADRTLRAGFDDGHLWQRARPVIQRDARGRPRGLVGHASLRVPSDFMPLAGRTVRRAQLLVQRIVRMSQAAADLPPERGLVTMVKQIDRLSDLLCGVIDLAELVRHVHPDPAWVEAANETYEALCTYMNELNIDTRLHAAMVQVLRPFQEGSTVPPNLFAAHTVALQFVRDFEKSGIHLPDDQRTSFVKLSDDVMQLGRKFLQGCSAQQASVEVDAQLLDTQAKPGRLAGLLARVSQRRGSKVLLEPHEAESVLRTHPNAETRKAVYLATQRSEPEQVDTLEQLLKTRLKLANLVGKGSWADVALVDKMSKTPASVNSFLGSLIDQNKPLALQETARLARYKQQEKGTRTLPTIAPWDRDYYVEQDHSQAERGRPTSMRVLSPYFSAGTCIQGLSRMFSSLYGLSFELEETHEGEVWDPAVRKARVLHDTDGQVGVIYFDLFERQGKAEGAAHYTIQCSRRVDDDDAADDFGAAQRQSSEIMYEGMQVSRGEFEGLPEDTLQIDSRGKRYQLPVIALTCSFDLPSLSTPSLLVWSEVTTLFHEMGHALHSMIGRTEFHQVSGTRCATDFVELPSVLMEHFASSREVLGLFARHYATDRPLPIEILRQLQAAMGGFRHIETNAQINMAALDQLFHSAAPGEHSFDSSQAWQDVQHTHSVMPSSERTSWQAQFGHLYGYGSTYYSYLFDTVLADRVWKTLFADDALSRENGERYAASVLQHGGGKDPWACVSDALSESDMAQGGPLAMQRVGQWGLSESSIS